MPKFDHRSLHAAGAALYLRTVASEGLAVMPTAAARGVIHLGARMHHTDDTARTERTTRGLAVLPQATVHHPVELDFLSHRAARKAQNFQLANQVALDAAVTIATESTEPDLQIQCATTAAHQLPMTICDGLRVPRINAAPRVVEAGPQFHRADIVAQRRSVTGDETPESPTSGARRITAPGLRFHHAGGVARNLIEVISDDLAVLRTKAAPRTAGRPGDQSRETHALPIAEARADLSNPETLGCVPLMRTTLGHEASTSNRKGSLALTKDTALGPRK